MTTETLRQAARLKTTLELARADYEKSLDPGWSEGARLVASDHYRQCDANYRAFLSQAPGSSFSG